MTTWQQFLRELEMERHFIHPSLPGPRRPEFPPITAEMARDNERRLVEEVEAMYAKGFRFDRFGDLIRPVDEPVGDTL